MGVSPNQQISALAVDREATGRILQFVPAALEDPSQPSQTVKMQADESYQAVFQRLGQDEYDLTDLVECLGGLAQLILTVISLNHLIHLTIVLLLALIIRTIRLLSKLKAILSLRTFALIVCAQRCCAGNATVIYHASLRLTGPKDKHGVENTVEKKFRPAKLLWIIGDPYFFNHESLTLLAI